LYPDKTRPNPIFSRTSSFVASSAAALVSEAVYKGNT
jgi:hypothetical protein